MKLYYQVSFRHKTNPVYTKPYDQRSAYTGLYYSPENLHTSAGLTYEYDESVGRERDIRRDILQEGVPYHLAETVVYIDGTVHGALCSYGVAADVFAYAVP